MLSYGVEAIVRIFSHLAFIYMIFWSMQALRLEQFFKANHYRQIRTLMVMTAIGLGYLCSTFFLEVLSLFRNLISSLPF